jgi:hypothetical protein
MSDTDLAARIAHLEDRLNRQELANAHLIARVDSLLARVAVMIGYEGEDIPAPPVRRRLSAVKDSQ